MHGHANYFSEMGRIRFRRARFQTPNLVSVFCPHRVPGREPLSSSQPTIFCAKVNSPSFSQNSPSLPQNSVRLSELSSPKQYSRNSIPLPFPTFPSWGRFENPLTSYRLEKSRNSRIPPNIQKRDSPKYPSNTPWSTKKYKIHILGLVFLGYFFDLLL